MFQSDETALQLYRRISFPLFSLVLNRSTGKSERISFGDVAELTCSLSDVSDAVLDLAFQYFGVFQAQGLFIHISTGNNMFVSLQHSRIDLSSTALHVPSTDGRLRMLLQSSSSEQPTLLVLEGLAPVLLSAKGLNNQPDEAVLGPVFEAIASLVVSKNAMVMWVNAGMGRVPGGSVATALRDGGGKDTMSVLFKQHVTRTMHYESTAAH